MNAVIQTSLKEVELLAKNHWLTHARDRCNEIVALNPSHEGMRLLREIDSRLDGGSALNLSDDHAPVAILLGKECVISTLHFRRLESAVLKQEAFRQAVNYIDIETSSRCNRKCQYCPNSQNDRFSQNAFIDDVKYGRFIADLALIDYNKELHFVGYSEPLLYVDDLLGRIAIARKKIPNCTIIVFTNGDFLEKTTVDQLVEAGADELKISVHLPVGKPYTDDAIFTRINKIAKRLGAKIQPIQYVKDTHISARLVHDRLRINIYQTDYDKHGSNRASTLDNVGPTIDVRTAACLMPFCQFIVGHKGAVMPCCVMVSDDPRNANYIMGHVEDQASIFDIYCGRPLVEWRRSLFNLSPKRSPCEKCAWDATSPLLNAPTIYEPWRHLVSPQLVRPVVVG